MGRTREIVRIDEEKCNGCGDCVIACAEGAIAIVDGKAKLVSEDYCDGLGNCLGTCPVGAITIEQREAEAFDEQAVAVHLARNVADERPAAGPAPVLKPHVCPSARAFQIDRAPSTRDDAPAADVPSQLAQWPVKLMLAPVSAPFYAGATLLLAADCVPFAFADFHRRFLKGRPLLTACPKFGDNDVQRDKLARIIAANDIRGVEVLTMEVPCCFGLVHAAERAVKDSGKDLPVKLVKIGIRGDVLEETTGGVPAGEESVR